MMTLLTIGNQLADRLDRLAPALLPTFARLVFLGVLFVYFWSSGLTKIGTNPFSPAAGAYIQIFPQAMEAAGYDPSQLGLWRKLVVIAGTFAELALPVLIVVGLMTRLAALGMVGFVIVQSLTDIVGHKAGAETVGQWFDTASGALIMDQRALWLFLLVVLVVKGGGPISIDRAFRQWAFRQSASG